MRSSTRGASDLHPRAGLDTLRRIVNNDVVGQVLHTLVTRVGLVVVGLITSVLVARALGPEGRGLYIVAITIGAVGVQLGNVGLAAANTYHVARDRSLAAVLVGNSIAASLVIGGLGAGGLAVLFLARPTIAPLRGVLLYLALASVPVGLLSLLLQKLLIGLDRIRQANQIDLGGRLLGTVALVLLLVGERVSVESLFLAMFLVGPVVLIWIVVRLRGLVPESPRFDRSILRESLGYGSKAWLVSLFSFLVIRSDLVMVQYLRGAGETGQYSIAVTLADFAYLLPLVVGTVLFPKLSAMDDVEERWRLAKRWAAVVGATMAIGVTTAPFLAASVIRLAYGPEFEPAVPALLWLLPGILFLGIETVIAQFLAASGMPRTLPLAWGGALVLNVGLNVTLLPQLGFVGAGVSSTISYGVMLLAVAAIARRVRDPEDAPRLVPLSWRSWFRLVPAALRPRVAVCAHRWLRRGKLLRRLRDLGTVRVRSVYGSTLVLTFDEDVDLQGVYVLGSYETGTTEICRRILRPGDVVMDIGSNLGWYTCLFSMCVGEEGRVHAFEPSPGTFERLRGNVELNDAGSNVRLNRAAVGDVAGPVVVRRPRGRPHGHTTTLPGADDEKEAEAPQTTLDAYATTAGIGAVALVKVDVEGAEPAVLAGAGRLLSREDPPMWIIEVNFEALDAAGSTPSRLFAPLLARGYSLLRVREAWGRRERIEGPLACEHGDNIVCYLEDVHGDRFLRI